MSIYIYGIGELTLLSYLHEDNPKIKKYVRYTTNRPFSKGYDSYQIMLEENKGKLYFLHTTLVSFGGACVEQPEHVEAIPFTFAKELLEYEYNRYTFLLEESKSKKDRHYVAFYQEQMQRIEDYLSKSPHD